MYTLAFLHVVAFLLGSIPVGYLIGRIKGVDVRKMGSGNTGATNLNRSLGKTAGILTLLGDILKGILSVYLVYLVPPSSFLSAHVGELAPTLGFLAILGHCYSPFLGFSGGKGVATSLGVFLVLAPLETLLCVFFFLVTVTFSRYISLGSLVSVGSMPAIIAIQGLDKEQGMLVLVALLTAILIFVRHRANITRLIAGTENQFSLKKAAPESQ